MLSLFGRPLDNSGLTNRQVDDILHPFVPWFLGTYSCDNVPRANIEYFAFICNLSRQYEVGTHFVAVVVSKRQRKAYYFDSYGMPCTNIYIQKYLQEYCNEVIWSRPWIQPVLSNLCGYYCIAFLLADAVGTTYEEFMDTFQINGHVQNDVRSL